jgi:hypothetical protein
VCLDENHTTCTLLFPVSSPQQSSIGLCSRFGHGAQKEEDAKMKVVTRRKGKKRTISGVIVPEDWDDRNRVIRVGVKISDYEEYIVEYNKQGKELMSLIDQKVRVKGKVRERLDGDLMISVSNYELIGKDEEGQYDA